jgi:hypothetical protein
MIQTKSNIEKKTFLKTSKYIISSFFSENLPAFPGLLDQPRRRGGRVERVKVRTIEYTY